MLEYAVARADVDGLHGAAATADQHQPQLIVSSAEAIAAKT